MFGKVAGSQADVLENETSAGPHPGTSSATGGPEGSKTQAQTPSPRRRWSRSTRSCSLGHSGWLWGLRLQPWPRPGFWASTAMRGPWFISEACLEGGESLGWVRVGPSGRISLQGDSGALGTQAGILGYIPSPWPRAQWGLRDCLPSPC